jgi:hypothetical protein
MSLFGHNGTNFDDPQQDIYAGGNIARGIYAPRGASIPQVGSKIVPATSTKTNVLTSANGTNSIMPVIDNKYSTFKSIASIVQLYEFYPLTEKIIRLIKDYIIRTLDDNADFISAIDEKLVPKEAIAEVNRLMRELDFKEILHSNYDKIIYYGSIAYLISEEDIINKETNKPDKKYNLSKLKSAHDVIVVSNDKLKFYLVQKQDKDDTPGGIKNTNTALGNLSSKVTTELLPDDKVLYLGSLDFELKHDKESKKIIDAAFKGTKKDQREESTDQFGIEAYKKLMINNALIDPDKIDNSELNQGQEDQKELPAAFNLTDKAQRTLFKSLIDHEFNLTASKPLYYSVHQMMKDYFIKDLLLYVLGVKSSIQPQVMTWGVDSNYNYTVDELMDLVDNLESRMNKLVDIETLNSANMDMDVLVNRILGNIRILPDLGNNIRALESKELDDITKKLDDLINRKNYTKDEILDALGIPKDLFEGATNREEVIKRDERFQSMVFMYIDRIKNSLKNAAVTLAKLRGYQIDPKNLEVPLFKKSGIEYLISAARLDSVREVTGTIVQVLNDVQGIMQTGISDNAELLEFMRKQFQNVGGDIAKLLIKALPTNPDEQQG